MFSSRRLPFRCRCPRGLIRLLTPGRRLQGCMMINLPFRIICLSLATLTTSVAAAQTSAQDGAPFDGHEWNLSTGNLSVAYIQASPIGSHPQDDLHEPPPSADSL